MSSLYGRYLLAKERLDLAKQELEELQSQLYLKFEADLDRIGETSTLSIEEQGYQVKIIKKEKVEVNQALASVIGVGFRQKFELDKRAYNNLPLKDQKRVDECLTTTPAKPAFKIERIM